MSLAATYADLTKVHESNHHLRPFRLDVSPAMDVTVADGRGGAKQVVRYWFDVVNHETDEVVFRDFTYDRPAAKLFYDPTWKGWLVAYDDLQIIATGVDCRNWNDRPKPGTRPW